ncbi:SpoIID/LytB domain-containing protein [Meiothermus taiwanensis]|nr:SpoIID/LytB domain-containing protein [Meiothermus taiwanensis]KIQ55514.1 SpoIID/LytB domain-containing protein [Meiothermus taiwanensis]KZK16924.1 SpoIID/LytB domain-containing protein [Meiothermus taiwanensis]
MKLAFLLVPAMVTALLFGTLNPKQTPPPPAPSGQEIRVLLSYQPGAASFEAKYLFPTLGLVPLGGSVQISSGPDRANLRPVVTVFADKPLTFTPQNGRLVASFEGLTFALEGVVQLKAANPAQPVLYRLLTSRPNRLSEYPGELWLELRSNGLLVVNRVDYQDYLKGVLPSEMPPHFHPEALKAQAVAARTYAFVRQQASTYWKQFGADVDDSSSEQVYHQTRRHPATDAAVEATRNQILTFEGRPIQSFFFSTSPGATASIEEVWMDRPPAPYLKGRSQTNPARVSLESESEALAFFQDWNPEGFYDAISPFWRWKLRLSREELEALLRRTLPERARLAPQFVQTPEGPLSPDAPGFELGSLQKIAVLRRTTGGYVTALEIQTSTGRYVVQRESHIRSLLRPDKALTGGNDVRLELWQGEPRLNFPSLPSAAFALQEERDERGNLLGLTFWGGGFGHGVGMSQYGALGLARRGYGYQQILEHFYPGTTLTTLNADRR